MNSAGRASNRLAFLVRVGVIGALPSVLFAERMHRHEPIEAIAVVGIAMVGIAIAYLHTRYCNKSMFGIAKLVGRSISGRTRN
jgi:hypothetical protein